MSSRNYNKLYVHTNREEGSEKLLLGYQNDAREIVLFKDTETSFHVPYYTEPIKISDSTLIRDGATGGPFPAAADRIFKNRKNFGNVTSNGNPSDIADGVWFCSWLYKDEFGNVQWMDRYYNPGVLVMSLVSEQMLERRVYKKHDPVYRDVPSTMALEPGVHYRYFHLGEATARQIISTFQGLSGERLKLNLENWGTTGSIDTSLSANTVFINTNGRISDLYTAFTETDRVYRPTISFNNAYTTEILLNYDPSYALTEEFTLAAWTHSDNWNGSQATQLFGNFSSAGGMGLFIDTLSSYPFFVIPETGYGHVMYLNEGNNQFLDKSVQLTISLTASPQFVAIDSDHNVIICHSDGSGKLYKLDNVGKVLASTNLPQATEMPMQLVCGRDNTSYNDTVIVITDKAKYTYSSDLVLLNLTPQTTLSSTVASFAYNVEEGTTELIAINNVYDSAFVGETLFCLSAVELSAAILEDGNLYRRLPTQEYPELYASIGNVATKFAVDPYDRIWVLHGTNDVSVYDSAAAPLSDPVFKFDAGQNVAHLQKNISFICAYDRTTDTREWKCLIYYADAPDSLVAPQLYVYDMNGMLLQTIDMLSLFDSNLVTILKQQQQNFQFFAKGDFTGYEYRRVFNKIPPYSNNSQLIIRASLRDKSKQETSYVQFKKYVSMGNWDSKSWQHLVLVLQNRTFKLYVNGLLVTEMPYTGQYEMYYESQPSFYIGTPVGSQNGFNQEVGWTSAIFNGLFQDIKIYNYALDPKNLDLFQRESIPAQNMYWSLPTPSIQYVEKIERMFKNKIPGSKATFFNIKLAGTQITDSQTRTIIEQEIRDIVSKIKPAHAEFLNVHWVD